MVSFHTSRTPFLYLKIQEAESVLPENRVTIERLGSFNSVFLLTKCTAALDILFFFF